MATIHRLRRILGLGQPAGAGDEPPLEPATGPGSGEPPGGEAPVEVPPAPSAEDDEVMAAAPASCPSCGLLLDPPPAGSRRCPRCRERIILRRLEGRTIYLTEAAVVVFEAQRRREADAKRWTQERRAWLRRAEIVGVAARRRDQIAARPISAEAVDQGRAAYLAAADQAARAARRERRWDTVARVRRDQAAAIHQAMGSPAPPSDDVLALHREAITAELRRAAASGKQAELVGSRCCPACRRDDGRVFRIADELQVPRLPHDGCPHGLCACAWWIALEKPVRGRRRRTPPAGAPEPSTQPEES